MGSVPVNSTQLGWVSISSFTNGTTNKIPATPTGTAGTYNCFTNGMSCPIGSYMLSISGYVAITGGPTAGAITTIECGSVVGTSATPSANYPAGKESGFTTTANYTLSNSINDNKSFACTMPIVISTANTNVAGYASYTINTISVGLTQLFITSYTLWRIG